MVFDTDILIDFIKNKENAIKTIRKDEQRYITAVTYMELIPFCRDKTELKQVLNIFSAFGFTILDITQAVSISARSLVTQYALSHSLNMGDALIAAVCLEHNFTLCTSSTKHFKAVRGLNIKRYARA